MIGYIEKNPHPFEALKSLLSGGLRIFISSAKISND
jgi:hypothetical protein